MLARDSLQMLAVRKQVVYKLVKQCIFGQRRHGITAKLYIYNDFY